MDRKAYLLEMIRTETIPALGCTEPVAVAFTAACAKDYIEGDIERVGVYVSKNIYKNGKSVIIPNTKEYGLDLAAALGILCGKSRDRLLIFRNITEVCIEKAHSYLRSGLLEVHYLEESPDVYVEVSIQSRNQRVKAVVQGKHDHLARVEVNDRTVYEDSLDLGDRESYELLRDMSFAQIRDVVEGVDIHELQFLEEGMDMNLDAANKGLSKKSGLGLGVAMNKMIQEGKLGNDVAVRAKLLTAAAADMRMGGEDCPIMTSSGSGNQGIGVILPIFVVAEEEKVHKEKLLRALFFAHIVNKYIKLYTGKLSAICGCGIAAGVGASMGISWMLGGNDGQIAGAATNMLSNLTGMICDGAKETCAFKLSTASGEAVISAFLALEGIIARPKVGIIGHTLEDSIKNLGTLIQEGFSHTDDSIVRIIM